MRRAAIFSICLLSAAALCRGKQPRCTLRLHTEANAHDGEVFSAQIQSKVTGKPVVIERMPMISEREVIGFRPYPAADGTFGVLVQLDEHGRLALDTLSVEKRGTLLFVFINGRPITELQIDRRVSDGRVFIASGLSANDIALMQKTWRLLPPRKE